MLPQTNGAHSLKVAQMQRPVVKLVQTTIVTTEPPTLMMILASQTMSSVVMLQTFSAQTPTLAKLNAVSHQTPIAHSLRLAPPMLDVVQLTQTCKFVLENSITKLTIAYPLVTIAVLLTIHYAQSPTLVNLLKIAAHQVLNGAQFPTNVLMHPQKTSALTATQILMPSSVLEAVKIALINAAQIFQTLYTTQELIAAT